MAKSIMIQGVASNVGKSFLVTGLCRLLAEDGYKVAPFKAQNMALNSAVTNDGCEIGRAQAVQAEAAMLECDYRMNPILLKPNSDNSSQVIVNGKIVGNMSALEYMEYKKKLVPEVKKAYDGLASEYDIIVIEGAGSPAEINLKKDDIANMGVAKLVNAPVLLAGDIDRGGVFAALYGTVKLLSDDEQALIKGLIINKFRGDHKILKPALEDIYKLTGKEVLGVVPYSNIKIDSEDSLSNNYACDTEGFIDTVIIKLPHISNTSDFKPLEESEDFKVRYVSDAQSYSSPDLVIIPGSKNTMSDLKWLKDNQLADKIMHSAAAGKTIIGLCGGYQMLQRQISDPYNMEHGGFMSGLGLLDAETFLTQEKRTVNIKGNFFGLTGILSHLNGSSFEGYEIHVGKTISDKSRYVAKITEGSGEEMLDGLCHGNVYGFYVHGIFDSPDILVGLAEALYDAKGVDHSHQIVDVKAIRQVQYKRLSELLRDSLDMDKIYKIIEEGVK